jgi:two-component system phosphate regulon sensor histidine kinase PhoR
VQTITLQAVRKIQPLIEERKAVIEYDWAEDEIVSTVDESHLELALINLLENALKYSPHPFIRIKTGYETENIFIEIKDNGIGIEKKYLTKIFRKFYRIPTGNIHDVKGFGLGLDFVKRVVDAHKGKIQVMSDPGIGTTFRILLPLS